MQNGTFVINGTHSSELKSFIQNRPELTVPRRKIDYKDIGGRSGSIPFDEEAYENTSLPLVLYTSGSSKGEAEYNRMMVQHVFDSGTYIPFIPYFDSRKIYMVTAEGIRFSGNRSFGHNQPYTMTLNVKPYKFLIDSIKREGLSSPLTITNPMFIPSKPLMTLHGTGDCTLVVNGESFVFKGITGSIIIDSENEFCYSENGLLIENENDKMFTLDYPELVKGVNTLSWTTGFTLDIEPKWRTLI